MSPNIDVSQLMLDPDFVQPLTLVRRTETVNNFGQNVIAESPKSTFGCVQPISGKTLMRIPEALRVANVQEFWLKETIVSGVGSQYPDIIVKNGVRFAVQVIFDWSDWGQGWTQGTCVAESPTGAP